MPISTNSALQVWKLGANGNKNATMRVRPNNAKSTPSKPEQEISLKLLCQDEEVFTVVADIDDGGELKLKRALELQEINFSVLRTLQPRSHYNSLLFLRKEGFLPKTRSR